MNKDGHTALMNAVYAARPSSYSEKELFGGYRTVTIPANYYFTNIIQDLINAKADINTAGLPFSDLVVDLNGTNALQIAYQYSDGPIINQLKNANAVVSNPATNSAPAKSVKDCLNDLKDLLDSGTISTNDYNKKKADILNSL